MKSIFGTLLSLAMMTHLFANCGVTKRESRTHDVSSIKLDTVNTEVPFTLTFLESDTAFDYYKIELKNNTDTAVYFIYDPAAFDPESKKGNELYCGSFNTDEKYYSAILYNMDHLEISKTFKISPYKAETIYVKWNIKYRSWEKELSLEYAKPDEKGYPVVGDQMEIIWIKFEKK